MRIMPVLFWFSSLDLLARLVAKARHLTETPGGLGVDVESVASKRNEGG